MTSKHSPSEILNVRIGGLLGYDMREGLLKSASRDGGSKIPAGWSSNKLYEQLAVDGLVIEGGDVVKGWQRQWLITDAGRAVLRAPRD